MTMLHSTTVGREAARETEKEKGAIGEKKWRRMKKERNIPNPAWLIAGDWKQMHSRSDVIRVDLESPSGLRGTGIGRL